jgi:hypothetical protein
LGAVFVLGAGAAVGCSTSSNELGDETHFVCKKDDDCVEVGPGLECRSGLCVIAGQEDANASGGQPGMDSGSADSGNDTGTGGTTVCESTGGIPNGDCSGSAGALAILGSCADQVQAGLNDVECPTGGGSERSALARACDRAPTLPSIFYQLTASCFAELGTYDTSTQELDEDALCAPALRDDVIACLGVEVDCPRPLPVCFSGGTLGCTQIRAACPGISEQHCVNGFDSIENADRVTVAECISDAPSSEDCVDAFFRCAWGI